MFKRPLGKECFIKSGLLYWSITGWTNQYQKMKVFTHPEAARRHLEILDQKSQHRSFVRLAEIVLTCWTRK